MPPTTSSRKTYKRIGILKGGQLGRMLIQSAMNYGLLSFVMDKDPQAPSAHYCTDFTIGNGNDFDEVVKFGKRVDLLTLEFEDINVDALFQLQSDGLTIHPDPSIIKIVQDKGLQKKFFIDHNFPTADFVLIENREGLKKYKDWFPAVQKTRKSGYDGKGIFKIKAERDLSKAFDVPSLLEKKIGILKEISVMVARNEDGDVATYPSVEMEFNPDGNMLDFLVAPAQIPEEIEKEAARLSKAIAEKLKLVGLLAVEMFITKENKILINEISPRPHNSGHHTIEASITSQFDQHIRAIMGWPLGETRLRSAAVMVNLLGDKNASGMARYEGLDKILNEPGVYVHIYGKEKTEPLRKMGHITILDDDPKTAKEKAKWVKQTVRVTA